MSTNINMTINLEIGVEEEEVGQSSINYQAHFETSIAQLKAENRYRIFANLERDAERFPKALWRPDDKAIEPRDVTIWCSNDYLGMGGHSKIRAAAQDAIGRHGVGAGGTRNISGTHQPIVQLEDELADLHHKESALVFTSGWISNLAALSTIAGLLPNCLILSDALNHNSMIEGIRRSGCEKQLTGEKSLRNYSRNACGARYSASRGALRSCIRASSTQLFAQYSKPLNMIGGM